MLISIEELCKGCKKSVNIEYKYTDFRFDPCHECTNFEGMIKSYELYCENDDQFKYLIFHLSNHTNLRDIPFHITKVIKIKDENYVGLYRYSFTIAFLKVKLYDEADQTIDQVKWWHNVFMFFKYNSNLRKEIFKEGGEIRKQMDLIEIEYHKKNPNQDRINPILEKVEDELMSLSQEEFDKLYEDELKDPFIPEELKVNLPDKLIIPDKEKLYEKFLKRSDEIKSGKVITDDI
jgi:hypothetical protein